MRYIVKPTANGEFAVLDILHNKVCCTKAAWGYAQAAANTLNQAYTTAMDRQRKKLFKPQ